MLYAKTTWCFFCFLGCSAPELLLSLFRFLLMPIRKISVLVLGLCLFCLGLQAQPLKADEVPYNIHETFYAKFQRTKENRWEKRPGNIYFVSFKKGDKSLMAEFSEDGRWRSTIYAISVPELPRDVIVSVNKNMPGHKMKKALKQETLMRGLIYTVTTEKDKKTYEFTFNPKGKLLYYTEQKETAAAAKP